MKKKLIFLIYSIAVLGVCVVLTTSCKKDSDDNNDDSPAAPVASTAFLNLAFNTQSATYFSTDGSMTTPVDSNQAKLISSKIDITFFYNYDYDEPGFLDPVTRSQSWYWNDYFKSWLSNAVETRYYSTALTKADFDAAQADQSKIATCFSSASTVLAPHSIFPTGSCIGGRQTASPQSITLSTGQVFAFKNTVTGKRGLLYIRTDQASGWPMTIFSYNTKVDIIREN